MDKKIEVLNSTVLLKQISLAAHDLNNALSVAGGYPDILLNNEFSPEKTAFFLEQMKIAVHKAKYTTDLLLALGRCSAPDLQVLELNSLLSSCYESAVEETSKNGKAFYIVYQSEQEKFYAKLSEPLFRQLISIFIDQFISAEGVDKLILTLSKDSKNAGLIKLSFMAYQADDLFKLGVFNSEYFTAFVTKMIISGLGAECKINDQETQIEIYLEQKL